MRGVEELVVGRDHFSACQPGATIKAVPIVARMDEGNGYRGWDLWLENGRPGAHVIHKWQEDAVKVVADAALTVNKWHHVLMTYDGAGKAAGVKIYIDGRPQSTKTLADSLAGSIRTTVPFKVSASAPTVCT